MDDKFIAQKEVLRLLEEAKPELPPEYGPARSLKQEYTQLLDKIIEDIKELPAYQFRITGVQNE